MSADGITPVARVMLESPLPQLDRLFDYRIPPHLAEDARPGVRVKVPLRTAGRVSRGYIVEVTNHADYVGTLSDIEEVVSPVPVLAPEVWQLARRVATRAAGNASDVVRIAVPPRQVRVEKAWAARQAAARDAAASQPGAGEVAKSQTAAPSAIRDHADAAAGDPDEPAGPGGAPAVRGYGEGVVERAIAGRARLAITAVPTVRQVPGGSWVGAWAETMAAMAAGTLRLGRSAILVVPDYRDQQQLETALQGAGVPADLLSPLDAHQTNPERYGHFLECLEEHPRVIYGTRSAIFAPAHELGLIAVWDDGDPLHNEPLSPYVSTRDAALVRQELSGAALAFVAHSRSSEVERLVELGFLADVEQSPRFLPNVVPTSAQVSNDRFAQSARIPSAAWNAVRTALESGPVLVQVARPGYAPVLACASCNSPAHCLVCDGPLRTTTKNSPPSCAWCGAIAAQWQCRHCEGTTFRLIGQGSTRTAEDLGRAFPATRIVISDGTRSLGDVSAEPALVIATRGAEPVAAGGYRAVLLLDGERMLARESLTVAEDCLRWWSNAIALAAPRAPAIIVGVGGELARTLVTWQQNRFARSELADRRRLRFPPAVRVATVRGTAEAVAAAVQQLHDSVQGEDSAKIDVLGPVPDGDEFVRSIVRFDYAVGVAVAATLRAAVIKNATSRRKIPGKPATYRSPPTLRVRFDDLEILD
ncbi:primosomal protein N' [Subtercola boreus]|uniref:Preprotein translocase subunit SecA n=1 Tax=Subtercola boreus TaxID=120213 RepID=A0A3E0WD65_9MICO|nr:primosomal protein N' [Subtercola boreus]RFA21296.1 preprotein translocase subunit SecA [Subtercola boreus]RFA21679.1 preprotein translocase subunit SecA [Subtercola boreus]RFA27648.1 preprotein translocase subunit SecA [Subtercola boreus]